MFIISSTNLELWEGVTHILMTTTEIPTDTYCIYINIFLCIIYIMIMEKMWRQKCTPGVVYGIHNRMKLIRDLSDLLADLGIVHINKFFLLLVFFMAEKRTFDFIFFFYVIFTLFRNLERKNGPWQNSRSLLQSDISILTRDVMVISVCSSIVELTQGICIPM